MVIRFLNWIVTSICPALLRKFIYFALTDPAFWVSVLKERHTLQHHHKYGVLCDIVSEKKKFYYVSKLYIIERKFTFVMNIICNEYDT